VLTTMRQNKWISDAEVEEIEARVKAMVDESVQFAEESPYPEPHELYEDVYSEKGYPFIPL
jgi:pyruvate dehydrogenase E1 component alpha subunit